MKNIRLCLSLLFFILGTNQVFGAFPIHFARHPSVPTDSVSENGIDFTKWRPTQNGHISFSILRSISKLYRDHKYYGYKKEKSSRFGTSLLSGIFGIAAVVGFFAMLFFFGLYSVYGSSIPVAWSYILPICDLVLGVAAFVLGVWAMSKRQRLFGFALTGVIIGAIYIIAIFALLSQYGFNGLLWFN